MGQCKKCGSPITHSHMGGQYVDHCFTCCFWTEWVERDRIPENKHRSAVIKGVHWHICDPQPDPRLRGCGGRTYTVRWNDGHEEVTNNLWCQGDVPDVFRDQMPDNAEFV